MTAVVKNIKAPMGLQHPRPICHQTPQGLTIIAERMPVDVVNFSLWIQAGSAAEPDQHNGMAHFLEHMVFKGTPRLAPGDFERLVEQRGGVMNAATSQDYTCFYSTVAPQDFAAVAPAQIDLVLNAQIPEAEFERERQVVLEEILRAQDNPRQRVFAQTMAIAFEQLPYRRPVLGSSAIVQGLTAGQMKTHHALHYQPRKMTAVVVGNLPEAALIESVVNSFEQYGDQPPLELPLESPLESPKIFTEPRIQHPEPQVIYDSKLTQARLFVLWHVPGLQRLLDTYEFDLIARILARGRNSRLVQDLRETQGLVSSISASNYTQFQQGLFWIAAHLPPDNIAPVKAAICEHIQRLQTSEVALELLQNIQRQIANQFIFDNETPASRAGLYGFHQAIAADLRAGLNYPQQIKTITPEQLRTAATAYLSLDTCRWVTFLPDGG